MYKCSNCGKEYPDNSKFCGVCGGLVYEVVFCPECGIKAELGSKFCDNCGVSLEEKKPVDKPEIKAVEEEKNVDKFIVNNTNPKKTKRLGLFAGLGVAIAGCIFIVSTFLQGNRVSAVYLTNGRLMYGNNKEDSVLEIRQYSKDKFYWYDTKFYAEDYYEYIRVSEDSNHIYFFNDNNLPSELCYINGEKGYDSLEIIASNVSAFEISPDGKTVAYVTSGNLYLGNRNNRELICSDVELIRSVNGFEYLWIRTDYTGFLWNKENGLVSVGRSAYYDSITNDEKIFCIENKELYKVSVKDGATEVIDYDVDNIVNIYKTGEVYYTKYDNGYHIYYYNGNISNEVATVRTWDMKYSEDVPILFAEYNFNTIYLIKEGNFVGEVDNDIVYIPTNDENIIYAVGDIYSDGYNAYGTLVKGIINSYEIEGEEIIDSDVERFSCTELEDGRLVYFKNVYSRGVFGDMYIDGVHIADDVALGSVQLTDKGLYYIANYGNVSDTYEGGDLMLLNNDKTEKVLDDIVSSYRIDNKGNIIYIANYVDDIKSGMLYIFDGKESKFVSSNSEGLINPEKFFEK